MKTETIEQITVGRDELYGAPLPTVSVGSKICGMIVSELSPNRLVLHDPWLSILWVIPAGIFLTTVGVLGLISSDSNKVLALFMLFTGCTCFGALALNGNRTFDVRSRSLTVSHFFGMLKQSHDLSRFCGVSVDGFDRDKESIFPLFVLNVHWENQVKPEIITCISRERHLKRFPQMIWLALCIGDMFGSSFQFNGTTKHLPEWFQELIQVSINRDKQESDS